LDETVKETMEVGIEEVPEVDETTEETRRGVTMGVAVVRAAIH
jgi:hypothetical protein